MQQRFRLIKLFFTVSFLLLYFWATPSIAQERFSLSGLLEPDYRESHLTLPNGNYIFISKTKGGQGAKSPDYSLECYSPQLKKLWQKDFEIDRYENINYLDLIEDRIILFSVRHELENHNSELIIRKFDFEGRFSSSTTLLNASIHTWNDYPGKASVKQTFVDAISAIQNKGFVTPLEYRYEVVRSPDKSKLLVYRYDYSQDELLTHSYLYGKNLELLDSGIVPVDKGFVSYGQAINNRGELYHYTVNSTGKVAIIQYNLGTKESKYLQVQTANSSRENLKIQLYNDDVIYLAKLNKKNGDLVGVSYSRFDFKKGIKDTTVFHPLNVELKRSVNAQQRKLELSVEKEWSSYELIDFFVDSLENVTLFVEKRHILSDDYTYNESSVEHPSGWIPRNGEVLTETLLLFSFNNDYHLKWDAFVVKKQQIGVVDGINTVSVLIDNEDPENYRLVYADRVSPNAIPLNQIYYLEIDKGTGACTQQELLNNPLKLSLSRPYSFFDTINGEEHFIFVGKKGILGKKTYITSIKL